MPIDIRESPEQIHIEKLDFAQTRFSTEIRAENTSSIQGEWQMSQKLKLFYFYFFPKLLHFLLKTFIQNFSDLITSWQRFGEIGTHCIVGWNVVLNQGCQEVEMELSLEAEEVSDGFPLGFLVVSLWLDSAKLYGQKKVSTVAQNKASDSG